MRTFTLGIQLGTLILLWGCGGSDSPLTPDPVSADAPIGASAADGLGAARSMAIPENFPIQKILCFGDSVTLGITLSAGEYDGGVRPELAGVEGYVPKLWRRLEERYGTGFELVTEAVGGENTREALDRIDTMIRRHDPDAVLILTGIVDINVALPLVPRFPVVRSNIAEMIRITQLRGKIPIIGTYPRVNPDGFRVGAIEYIERLNDVIRQEANGKNAAVADHEAASGNTVYGQGSDGLHPNNLGYERMADTWMAKLEEVLEGMGVT